MKKIVEHYAAKGVLFRSLKPILPKRLGSRKKLSIYLGVDMQRYYVMVILIEKKSRILKKEAEVFEILHQRLEKYIDSKIQKKELVVNAPLCSKAKAWLEEKKWKVGMFESAEG